MAETQVMPSSSAVRFPSVTAAMPSATSPIAPVSSSAPTITNSPMKKNSVSHSIPAMSLSTLWRETSSITAGAGQRDGRGLEVQWLVGEEEEDRDDQDRDGAT